MADLRECPFCGGSAVLRHEYTGCGFSYIECERCGLVSVKFAKSFDRSSDEDAKIYWNRRYTPVEVGDTIRIPLPKDKKIMTYEGEEIDFDYGAEDE